MAPAGYQHIAYLRRFRVVAYWLVFLSIAGLSIAEPNRLVFLVGTIGTIASWLIVERPRGKALPRWMINSGVIFGAFLLFWELVVDSEQQGNLLIGLGHFMVAILICKLFETKQNRDYAQILTLSLLIIVSGAFFPSDISALLYSIILLIYLGLGIYALLILHLRADTERALSSGSAPAEITMPLEHQQRLKKDVRRMAYRLSFVMILFAAVAFVLIPRSSVRESGAGSISSAMQQTGFTNESNFHEFTNLLESDKRAMTVTLTVDGIEQKFTSELYFRGITYDTYDLYNRRWRNLSPSRDRAALLNKPEVFTAGDFVQQYEVYPGANSNVIFSLAVPPGSGTGSPVLQPATVSNKGELLQPAPQFNREDFSLLVGGGNIAPPLSYTITSPRIVKSIVDETPGVPFKTFIDHETEFLTSQPNSWENRRRFDRSDAAPEEKRKAYHDKLTEVALDILKQIESETARRGAPTKLPAADRLALIRSGQATTQEVDALATDIVAHLRDNYKYSLSSTFPPGEDPVLHFLRVGKSGHCEYFASSMVLLLRVAGLNARMVAGYHGGDPDGSQTLTVRQKDAHAWVEVFIPNRGWCMYDPSPAAGPTSSGSWAWVRSIKNFFSSLESSWFTKVVSFDGETRKEILNSIKGFFSYIGKIFGEIGDFIFSPHSSWQTRVSVTFGFLVVAVGGIWLYKKWRHRRISPLSRILRNLDSRTQRQLEQDLAFFDQLMTILSRSGKIKSDDATPREYVDTLATNLGSAKSDANFLIETFYAIRFGMARMSPDISQNVSASVEKVRLAMAQQR